MQIPLAHDGHLRIKYGLQAEGKVERVLELLGGWVRNRKLRCFARRAYAPRSSGLCRRLEPIEEGPVDVLACNRTKAGIPRSLFEGR